MWVRVPPRASAGRLTVVAGRIVLFGATGYTGRLTAEAMVERGLKPVLAARNRERLDALAGELGGGLETAEADVSRPESVRALVGRGDVLVTTVGPFARFGDPAAEAAADAGAHYLDSTGEPQFIRRVFEHFGPAAERTGAGMVTAFGYDYVPGNLAGALALRRAGADATQVEIGYFVRGKLEASGGTAASLAGAAIAPGFAWRGGRLVTENGGRRLRSFQVDGKRRDAISIGGSEHFALPRVAPQLLEVGVYLGWAGRFSRPAQIASVASGPLLALPFVRSGLEAATRRVEGSSGGPGPESRAQQHAHVVAIASDGDGRPLADVHLTGADSYGYTGRVLAWAAEQAASGRLRGAGALGPVDAFGIDELEAGNREAGIGEG